MNNSQAMSSNVYVASRKRNESANFSLKDFLGAILPVGWLTGKKQLQRQKDQLTTKDNEIAQLRWELLQRTEQLKNITYYQSHMVRRPLANILGITELIAADINSQREKEIAELISLLRISADDLDKAIKSNSHGI